MRLPLYFIDRPIMAAVLSLITLLIGAMAMLTLPISEYPDVVPPSIVIRATYPGASPETIATTVAAVNPAPPSQSSTRRTCASANATSPS